MEAVPLDALEVLAVDCQSTGATPRQGHVLEVAWCRLTARDAGTDAPVTQRLVQLPDGAAIPRVVMQLTGIREDDLRAAHPPEEVWRELLAALPGPAPAPAVVHFAVFEQRFLADWHASFGSGPFPLELLCTHELARRLLPGLPRRGLHALAGHLGLLLPEQRRSGDHARATARVWQALVPRMAERGVTTLGELRAFLAAEAPRRAERHAFPVPREVRLQAPEAPGVYRLRAPAGELLYVGKAASLRRRVNSYFQKRWRGEARMGELLTMAASVEWTVTETPLEAALLESDQIKELAPRFNKALRARAPEVWFATPDLRAVASSPDERHTLGPLPYASAVSALPALQRVLASGAEAEAEGVRLALGLPKASPLPSAGSLAEGLALVRDRRKLQAGASLAALLRVGATLWAEAQEEEGAEDGEALDWASYWDDPENVADALENELRRSTHLIRRARWFRQLRDSVVWWRAGDRLRWLVLRAGRVESRGDARTPSELPAPEADPRPLDAAAYDRLRILTTELRGLVQRGTDAAVHLIGGCSQDARRLARRLAWL